MLPTKGEEESHKSNPRMISDQVNIPSCLLTKKISFIIIIIILLLIIIITINFCTVVATAVAALTTTMKFAGQEES